MFEAGADGREIISEETMLSRLAQSEQMREFFIQMWMENPELAKQGGIMVRNLMTRLESDAPKVFSQQPSIRESGKQRGISLIELIMFIVIVSVSLAGILLVMNVTTRGSVDPMIHKQALAIAESLLEEVELMPFTFCDPDDANARIATNSIVGAVGGCNTLSEDTALGPEAGEARGSMASPFDNVSDYNGFTMAAGALVDITGTPVGPAGYTLTSIVVTAPGMAAAGTSPAIAGSDALLIAVTVTGPDTVPVVVEGMRTRYSPRGVP